MELVGDHPLCFQSWNACSSAARVSGARDSSVTWPETWRVFRICAR
jgi:hypothetical protein